MKNIIIGAFVIMVGAQWFVPLSQIRGATRTIREGREYKFKTAPVDPSDPFRGKYITLNYDLTNYYPADTNEGHFVERSKVYALLGRDSAGYAKINKLVQEPPTGDDTDYIEVTYEYGYGGMNSRVGLYLPFTTMYLEESKASEAEQLYWQNRRDSVINCYAKVMVLRGDAKLVDVMVNDSSIVDVVRRINKNKGEKED
jgi:uncharacterized membrane-anchored protein